MEPILVLADIHLGRKFKATVENLTSLTWQHD